MSGVKLDVYGIDNKYLGVASSFGEAKQLQLAGLPADLRDAYAGYQDGSPLFYLDSLTPELRDKYPKLRSEA